MSLFICLSFSLSVGLLQESFIDEPDGLVSVNLLVVSAVSAFATGAVLSGLAVCWIMSHRHRTRGAGANRSRKGDKEQNMLGQGRSGSVMSVTRTSGSERPRSHSQADNPFVMPNGWPKGEMDPGLPTPEQTPLQQKRPPPSMRDVDWDQSQTFLTSVGMPCPANSVIYLSSKFLQERGGRHEGPGDVGAPNTERTRYLVLASNREPHGGQPRTTLRNSAGEYNYPATPQDSPDRRRVVSAPSTQMDFGEPPRWTHEGLNYNSNNGAPYPSQRPGLIRANHHGLADFSHLMGKSVGEPTPSGQ